MGGDTGDMVEIIGLQVNTLTRIYEGTLPPSSPLPGDIFREYNSSNLLVEEWYRDASNSIWYSTKEYKYNLPFTQITATSTLRLFPDIPLDNTFNLYLTRSSAIASVSATNSATQYWTINLQRIAKTGAVTSVSPLLSTQSLAINNYHLLGNPNLNLAVNPTAVNLASFVITCGRISTASALNVTFTLYFKKQRL